jgi:hypothetical protein
MRKVVIRTQAGAISGPVKPTWARKNAWLCVKHPKYMRRHGCSLGEQGITPVEQAAVYYSLARHYRQKSAKCGWTGPFSLVEK